MFLTKFSKIAKLEKYRLSRGFSKKILDFLCWVLENTLIPDFESWMRWWHKRVYHMYSDVIFGWILWIWLSSWNFCLNILILFSQSLENVIFSFFKSSLENLPGVVVGLRPPRIPRQIFKRSRKKSKYQKKVPTISQMHNISQKNVSIYIIYGKLGVYTENTSGSCCSRLFGVTFQSLLG